MTADDVDRACAVLEQQGKTPSGNLVLAHLKQRGLPASKRTVLKYLKLRTAEPQSGLTAAQAAPVSHATAAEDVGPVAPAERALRLAELRLSDARDALLHAKGVLAAAHNLPIAGILRGSLHPGDDFPAQALDDVDLLKRE